MKNLNVTFANQYGKDLAQLEIGKKWVNNFDERREQILSNLDYQIEEVMKEEGVDVEDLATEIFRISYNYNLGVMRFKNAGMKLNETLINVGKQLDELLNA